MRHIKKPSEDQSSSNADEKEQDKDQEKEEMRSDVDEVLTWNDKEIENLIKIAAIDNGLAFPFKHPDQWRACT